jgi:hypothetical protein
MPPMSLTMGGLLIGSIILFGMLMMLAFGNGSRSSDALYQFYANCDTSDGVIIANGKTTLCVTTQSTTQYKEPQQ